MSDICGVDVRGVELRSAANMLANHMKISLKVSHGWFWRFCKQYGMVNKRTHKEALSAPKEEKEPYRQKLVKMISIDCEIFLKSKLYNSDEIDLF